MANVNRLKEMARGGQPLDGWRLRTLTEEKAHGAKADLVGHAEALLNIEKRLDRGDVAGAISGLQEIQNRIGETIEGLK